MSSFADFARENPEEALRLAKKLQNKVVVPHPGQRPVVESDARFKVLNCGRRWGKILADGTPVLTPTGWKDHSDLVVGDLVVAADGRATEVTAVYPHEDWQFYEVCFNDGTVIEAGAEHLWEVHGKLPGRQRGPAGRGRNRAHVLSTADVAGTLSDGNKGHRWSVPLPSPVTFAPGDPLLIDPYVVGAALGDGTINAGVGITSDDPQIIAEILARTPEGVVLSRIDAQSDRTPTYHFTAWGKAWSDIGLKGARSGTKFIPEQYLRSTVEERLSLLRGLMDTDGWCYQGRASFCSSSKQLCEDVKELVDSLGGRSGPLHFKKNDHANAWTITFYTRPEHNPFMLRRKARLWNHAARGGLTKKIVSITKGRVANGQCITVADERALYVVDGYTLTHNTVIGSKLLLEETLAAPPGSVTWWVAPTYRVVKRGYREVLRQLPREYLSHDPQPDTNFDAGRSVILKFKNGTQIEFYSAERPEGMLGEGVHYVVLDEAASMPSRVWEQIISPTLMDHKGGACFISTPRGRNWFYRAWREGQSDEAEKWASWTFPTATNPHIDQDEIDELERTLPRVLFEQEVLAKFLAAGSSVFQWPEGAVQYEQVFDNGLVEGVEPRGAVFLGIDLAKTKDYTVMYGAREDDRSNVYFERFNSVKWSEQKRRIARAVDKLMREGAENVTLMMDSTGVGDPIVEDMEEAGYDVIGVKFTSQSKSQMVVSLAKDLEQGKAYLLNEGEIVEFENFQMDTTPSGRLVYAAPEGEKDDCVAAKMLSHWGMTTEGSPGVTTISANAITSTYKGGDPGEDLEEGFHDYDVEDAVAAEAIGLPALHRRPTTQELLNNPDLWA